MPSAHARIWLIRLSLFTLAGAMINIGLAWCAAALTTRDLIPVTSSETDLANVSDRWPLPAPDHWPQPQQRASLTYHAGREVHAWAHLWKIAHPEERFPPRDEPMALWMTSTRVGWPLHSMHAWEIREIWIPTHHDKSWTRRHGAIELPAWCRRAASAVSREEVTQWAVPTLPLWPGFAVNTAIDAATAGLLWTGLSSSRHLFISRLRRHHSRCPKCGYVRNELPKCPECGKE